MNARVLVPDEAVDDTSQPAGIRTRLGLRRTNELPVEQLEVHPIETLVRGGFASLARRFMSLENPLVTIGVPFATVALLVFGLVWGLESERTAITLAKRELPAVSEDNTPQPSRHAAQPTPTSAREPIIAPPIPEITRRPTVTEPTHPATREPTDSEPTIPHHVLRWSRPELLVEPEIADRLALTPQQLDRLRELAKTPADESDPHAIGKAALALLRSDQQKQWISIVTNAHNRARRGVSVPENDQDSRHSDGNPFASDAEAHQRIKAEALRPVRLAP